MLAAVRRGAALGWKASQVALLAWKHSAAGAAESPVAVLRAIQGAQSVAHVLSIFNQGSTTQDLHLLVASFAKLSVLAPGWKVRSSHVLERMARDLYQALVKHSEHCDPVLLVSVARSVSTLSKVVGRPLFSRIADLVGARVTQRSKDYSAQRLVSVAASLATVRSAAARGPALEALALYELNPASMPADSAASLFLVLAKAAEQQGGALSSSQGVGHLRVVQHQGMVTRDALRMSARSIFDHVAELTASGLVETATGLIVLSKACPDMAGPGERSIRTLRNALAAEVTPRIAQLAPRALSTVVQATLYSDVAVLHPRSPSALLAEALVRFLNAPPSADGIAQAKALLDAADELALESSSAASAVLRFGAIHSATERQGGFVTFDKEHPAWALPESSARQALVSAVSAPAVSNAWGIHEAQPAPIATTKHNEWLVTIPRHVVLGHPVALRAMRDDVASTTRSRADRLPFAVLANLALVIARSKAGYSDGSAKQLVEGLARRCVSQFGSKPEDGAVADDDFASLGLALRALALTPEVKDQEQALVCLRGELLRRARLMEGVVPGNDESSMFRLQDEAELALLCAQAVRDSLIANPLTPTGELHPLMDIAWAGVSCAVEDGSYPRARGKRVEAVLPSSLVGATTLEAPTPPAAEAASESSWAQVLLRGHRFMGPLVEEEDLGARPRRRSRKSFGILSRPEASRALMDATLLAMAWAGAPSPPQALLDAVKTQAEVPPTPSDWQREVTHEIARTIGVSVGEDWRPSTILPGCSLRLREEVWTAAGVVDALLEVKRHGVRSPVRVAVEIIGPGHMLGGAFASAWTRQFSPPPPFWLCSQRDVEMFDMTLRSKLSLCSRALGSPPVIVTDAGWHSEHKLLDVVTSHPAFSGQ
jgi:hypothetical protein